MGTVDECGWRELLKTLKVEGKLHPTSVAALDAYESETGFRLPASYRSFCQVVGPGDVGDWFNIAVPGFAGKYKDQYDLSAKTALYHERRDWEEYSSEPKQFARAIIFGDDCTGALFFWDPAEVTMRGKREYAIYVVWRGWSLERVCDSFWEFVNICLHRSDRTLYDDCSKVGFRAAWFGRGK
jgi:hypothetical protein